MSYLLISTSLGAHPLHIPNLQDRHARAYGLLDLRGAQCRVQLHPRAAAKPWDFPMGKQRLSRGWSSLPFIFPFKMMSSLGFPCLDKLGFGKLEVWSEEHMLSWEGEHFNNSFGIEHRLRLKKATSTWSLLGFHVRFPPAANAANVGAYVFLWTTLESFQIGPTFDILRRWSLVFLGWLVGGFEYWLFTIPTGYFPLSPIVIFHYPQWLLFTIPNFSLSPRCISLYVLNMYRSHLVINHPKWLLGWSKGGPLASAIDVFVGPKKGRLWPCLVNQR